MQDRRGIAGSRAMLVARTYEQLVHDAEVIDTSAGDVRASKLIRDLLREYGGSAARSGDTVGER